MSTFFRALGRLLLLMIVLSVWVFSTSSGTQFLLSQVFPWVGVNVETTRGSLLEGLFLEKFTLENENIDVKVETIAVQIQWSSLWKGELAISALDLGNTTIALKPTPTPSQETDASSSLPVLPIDIVLERFSMSALRMDQVLPFTLKEVMMRQAHWRGENLGVHKIQVGLEQDNRNSYVYASLSHEGKNWLIEAQADVNQLDVSLLLKQMNGTSLPSSVLNGNMQAKLALSAQWDLSFAHIDLTLDDKSRWNKQKLQGDLSVHLRHQAGSMPEASLQDWRLEKADIHLNVGQQYIIAQGALGDKDDRLKIDISLPQFSAFYPSLQGGVKVQGEVLGNMLSHQLNLDLIYLLQEGSAWTNPDNIRLKLGLQGKGQSDWEAILNALEVKYQHYQLQQKNPVSLSWRQDVQSPEGKWTIGPSNWVATLREKNLANIALSETSVSGSAWETKGNIRGLVLNASLLDALMSRENAPAKGGVIVRQQSPLALPDLRFDVDWDLAYQQSLQGKISLQRQSGDLELPLEKPFKLGLEDFGLSLDIVPQQGELSAVNAQARLNTKDKGQFTLQAKTMLQGLSPSLKAGTQLSVKGGLKDIAWLSVFSNDLLSLGGAVEVDLRLNSQANGQWQSFGSIQGKRLRIVEIENGVRLLEGSLKASLHQHKLMIEELHFPSVIRVVPSEWRTRQWIEENPQAQQGSLRLNGQWDIERSKGLFQATFDHYPIVQRTDRFAMMSGDIEMDIALPKMSLMGKLRADAGWASIDLQETIPTVDGDVIILKSGQTLEEVTSTEKHLGPNLDLAIDLGPRFYLVGLGLNSGLVGAINLHQDHGRLTAEGQFKTRGGAVEAYGQRLQIARGEITFSGNISNPSLNIEAVRRGLEVEAGVRVMGTAKKPKITLISRPEVSEVEKLSWLIMGRGPDSSSADLALLLSVGGSFFGGEEPFYRKLGINEVGVRAGSVGDVGSVLPDRTVADSVAYRAYEQANQLFYATKKFGDKWRVSVEQSLAGTGTVLRGSYLLLQNLTVDLKVGTVNGIELLYKKVFKD